MIANTASAVIEKIDEALKDNNFETRQGLRFMATVMKEAMLVIGEVAESKNSTNTRLINLENGLNDFLLLQTKRQEHNEVERAKWRWAIIAPIVTLILAEIARWIFR